MEGLTHHGSHGTDIVRRQDRPGTGNRPHETAVVRRPQDDYRQVVEEQVISPEELPTDGRISPGTNIEGRQGPDGSMQLILRRRQFERTFSPDSRRGQQKRQEQLNGLREAINNAEDVKNNIDRFGSILKNFRRLERCLNRIHINGENYTYFNFWQFLRNNPDSDIIRSLSNNQDPNSVISMINQLEQYYLNINRNIQYPQNLIMDANGPFYALPVVDRNGIERVVKGLEEMKEPLDIQLKAAQEIFDDYHEELSPEVQDRATLIFREAQRPIWLYMDVDEARRGQGDQGGHHDDLGTYHKAVDHATMIALGTQAVSYIRKVEALRERVDAFREHGGEYGERIVSLLGVLDPNSRILQELGSSADYISRFHQEYTQNGRGEFILQYMDNMEDLRNHLEEVNDRIYCIISNEVIQNRPDFSQGQKASEDLRRQQRRQVQTDELYEAMNNVSVIADLLNHFKELGKRFRERHQQDGNNRYADYWQSLRNTEDPLIIRGLSYINSRYQPGINELSDLDENRIREVVSYLEKAIEGPLDIQLAKSQTIFFEHFEKISPEKLAETTQVYHSTQKLIWRYRREYEDLDTFRRAVCITTMMANMLQVDSYIRVRDTLRERINAFRERPGMAGAILRMLDPSSIHLEGLDRLVDAMKQSFQEYVQHNSMDNTRKYQNAMKALEEGFDVANRQAYCVIQ